MKKYLYIVKFILLSTLVLSALYGISCRTQPPSITALSLTPAEITNGETSVLKWAVIGAESVNIDQGMGAVAATGSKQISPSKTTAYTLTATNSGGTVTRSVVIYVTEPPPPAPVVDNTPPVITSVSAKSEAESGATITWTTDELATSYVDYGKGTDYGLNASSTELTTQHSLALTGLDANTAYHFMVSSRDKTGNKASSADDMFVTAQEKSFYSLEVISQEWGRKTDVFDTGLGTTVEGNRYLYIKGKVQNKSQASLRAVIITMNCWSGSKIVKYEVYVYRGPSLPGQVFSYEIHTADDSTVDKVTASFADYLGKTIEVTQEQP
jgi:hypothetical protein